MRIHTIRRTIQWSNSRVHTENDDVLIPNRSYWVGQLTSGHLVLLAVYDQAVEAFAQSMIATQHRFDRKKLVSFVNKNKKTKTVACMHCTRAHTHTPHHTRLRLADTHVKNKVTKPGLRWQPRL